MTLYETIFARRSVRKYDDIPLLGETLTEIKNYAENAEQLAKCRFEIVTKDRLKGGIAPYALLAFADENDAEYVNIGYTLQGVDLWLQSRGFGSVWCGMASVKDAPEAYKIMLGFGNTGLPLRSGESDFKRNKIEDISNDDNAVARAARLAPSAVNFQPWKLEFADNKVVIRANVHGMGKVFPGKMYLFDLGIITKHVEIALKNEGKTVKSIDITGDGKNSFVTVIYA